MSERPSPRLLLVDRDPAARRSLQSALARLTGLGEIIAASPEEARELAPEGIAALILDDESDPGGALVGWLRREHPRALLLYISARPRDPQRVVAAKLQGAAWLQKPATHAGLSSFAWEIESQLSRPARGKSGSIPVLPEPSPTPPPGYFSSLHRSLAQAQSNVASISKEEPRPMSTAERRLSLQSYREEKHISSLQTAVPRLPREVIVIGASTGGPAALALILAALPESLTAPLVIVQHMLAGHIPEFAAGLARQSGRRARVAEHLGPLEPSTLYVAPPERHLLLARSLHGLVTSLLDAPPEHFCRPAVDPLFRSAASICGGRCVGVLLSGMGSDGALGAKALLAAGAPVITQDKESSVVWGMPGAAVALGASTLSAPASEIAGHLIRWCQPDSPSQEHHHVDRR